MIIMSKSPSKNRKVASFGPDRKTPVMPYVYTTYAPVGESCPLRCVFHPEHEERKIDGRGCYALRGRTAMHQRRASIEGNEGEEFRQYINSIPPPGSLVRPNISGGIAINGVETNHEYVDGIMNGFRDRPDVRGWMYTHVERQEWIRVKSLAPSNLSVNWSANSLQEALEAQQEGLTDITCVLTHEEAQTRRKGVTVCLEQSAGIPCSKCLLCVKPGRKTIIGFIAH